MVIVSATCRRSLLPLPTSRVGIPDAIREQPIQVGKVGIAVDEEVQAFAILLARPFASPHFPPRIVRVEVQAPERLPTAMVTTFDVAARAMAFADRRAAIRWFELLAHANSAREAAANSVRSPESRNRWPYVSKVMTMDECPNRVCTTFGGSSRPPRSFGLIDHEAKKWRKACIAYLGLPSGVTTTAARINVASTCSML
jgi:hypothetical protein